MPRLPFVAAVLLLAAACSSTQAPTDAAAPSPTPEVASVPASPSAEATPTTPPTTAATPEPSESQAPRVLTGVWRTTLGGQPLSLSLTETSYRIVRGSSSASGSVTVTGARIEFFDSDLCEGSGIYRWAITDGALSFFPDTEPCSGRAEALLVRYTDYTPRDD